MRSKYIYIFIHSFQCAVRVKDTNLRAGIKNPGKRKHGDIFQKMNHKNNYNQTLVLKPRRQKW